MARSLPRTGILAAFVAFAGCVDDPKPSVGTLRLVQASGRPGEKDDALGALVVGQAMCGTHVFIRSEGGSHAHLGGDKTAQSCLALPRVDDLRRFELSIYPVHTASTIHAQLLLDPSRCAAPSDPCGELCTSIKPPKSAALPAPDGTCPSSWIPLDQSTLVVGNILGAAGTSSGTTTGTTTGTSTGTTAGTGDLSSGTSGDGSTT